MSPRYSGTNLPELGQRARDQIRSRMRAVRGALSSGSAAARSRAVLELLWSIERLQRARSVALFWPRQSHREVDLRPLDAELAQRGVSRFYPFMDPSERGFSTGFKRVTDTAELESRGRGFCEPPRSAPVAQRGEIELVLVPALAVTPEGHRLGYGSGFYDVTLPDVAPPALCIAVAYSFQLLAELPVEAHDVRCQLVVTDREIFDPCGLLQESNKPSS
jgi:5-formyltetrahydrofolate cyclo-ligase